MNCKSKQPELHSQPFCWRMRIEWAENPQGGDNDKLVRLSYSEW